MRNLNKKPKVNYYNEVSAWSGYHTTIRYFILGAKQMPPIRW